MRSRLGRGLLWAMAGYAVGAVVTYGLTMRLSSNTHDRDLEALMTAVFVAGPIGALIGFVLGAARRSGPAG